ncbi:hypothetical protein GIB67_022884 [Kingdonia uniflora]|uniref:Uncharacterized protein n=1 Tax=Kingdonia uniflora TaxID=39325 RepID=A0A7J7MWB6_9MAGN|nr:hypothetical protein GIB67_022884 [Kingdonia uniflora]
MQGKSRDGETDVDKSILVPHKEDLVAANLADDPANEANIDEGYAYFTVIHEVRQNLNQSSWAAEMEYEEQETLEESSTTSPPIYFPCMPRPSNHLQQHEIIGDKVGWSITKGNRNQPSLPMENRVTSKNNQFEALIDVEEDIEKVEHAESTPSGGQDGINTNASTHGESRVADATISQVLTNEEVPSFADEDITIELTNEDNSLEGDEYLKVICEVRHYLNPKSWAGEIEPEDQGTENWALFLKSKFSTKNGDTIRYHKPSTIWYGIRTEVAFSIPYIGWLIGDGKKIDFWKDT